MAVERPIIFSAPMVRALLAGRKTQTRRLATSPLAKVQPEDRLWVKEAWCQQSEDGAPVHGAAWYRADGEHVVLSDGDGFSVHRADGREASPWRNPMFMPRWASRLTLLVTDVRVRQLQDISEEDAKAEAPDYAFAVALYDDGSGPDPRCYVTSFQALWDHLHGAGAWALNPKVVALSFTVERSAQHG